MTRDEAIKILHTEMECVSRPDCDRLACAYCDLAMRAEDVLTAYQMAITALETDGDCISRQAALYAIYGICNEPVAWLIRAAREIEKLPSVQPERTCVNCGRTANNGGLHADGRTRCPIEEHYALPKDGFCHLWEKRNITDDDYPERREE